MKTTEQKPLDVEQLIGAIRKAAVTLKKLSDKAYLVDVIDTRERDGNELISSDLVGHANALSALTDENAQLRQQNEEFAEFGLGLNKACEVLRQQRDRLLEALNRLLRSYRFVLPPDTTKSDAEKLADAAIKEVEESQ